MGKLEPSERTPLIWFIVLFPVLVLVAFLWLVTKFPRTLYGPRDFQTDENFLKWVYGSAAETAKEIEALLKERDEIKRESNEKDPYHLHRINNIETIIDERKKYIHYLYDFAQKRILSSPELIIKAAQKSLEREPKSIPTAMILDVANFTNYVDELGPLEAGTILDTYQSIVSKTTRIHAGSEISHIGDGHILIFSGPNAAIMTALELLENINGHPYMKRLSEVLKIRAAIGLHTQLLETEKKTEIEKLLDVLNPNEIGITKLSIQKTGLGDSDKFTLNEITRRSVTFYQVNKC